ncbi:mucin-2-like isoform X2 [Biomphalaria glabrata]|uniref:Mucin-2-like isoform X2 n=1 Tax=Biomphalaria glabrata TaxID=6526 RepID=A0A9W3BAK3_BIOGL|nr:mucin-2-like isoform X2 [Biomphalaria glabrata]
MDVKMKSHLTAVRKSTRTIKKTQRVLESADSSLDDLLDNPPKKPRTSSKPRRRNIDYCKDGTPFKCSLCESSYINTSAAKAKKRMEKFPIERERNGTTMLLCVKCSMAITLLDCKKPSAEEREKFEEEGKQFADSWVKLLNEPEACRLYCSLYSSSKCGCIQSYVNGTLALTRKRKNSHSISESGQSDASETVSVNTEPSEQSEPSDRMKYLVSLLKQSQAIKEKLQKKRSFTDEEVNSLNKSLDQFVLSNRVKLMNLGICERGCQRVLCYSNNFLRKKTASYSQARLQKTKLATRLANCIDLQELHKIKCCEKECCLVTANSLDKLKEWREQSQVSQNDMWKVIAEMFGSKCTGSQTGHCAKFIKMVTGCCNTTIQKVYFNILLAKGDTRKPEHGMKHHWKRQRKNSTKSCEEVLHSSSKGLAKKMKIIRISKDKQQSVTFALTESTHLKPDVTLTESTHLKPVNVTLTEPPQSVAFVETKQAVMSTVNNVQLPIEAMPTAAAPVCGQISAISSEGSPGNQLTMTSLPVAQQVSSMSCLSATATTESSSQPVDIEQTLKKAIPQLCGNLEDVNSTIKLLELVTGLVEIQRQKDSQQLPQQSLTGLVGRVQTGDSSSAALTTSGQLHIQSKVPQPVPAKSGSTMAHSTFLKKTETVTLVSSPSSRASFTDPMCTTSMSLRQIHSSAGPPVPATSLGSLITTTINSSQLEPAPVSSLDMTHLQAVTINPAPSQLLGTGNYVQILANNMSQLTSGQQRLVSGKPPPGTTSFILTGQLKPDSYENKDNSAFSSQTSLATLLTSSNPITQTIATCTETQALESNQFLNSSSHSVTSHNAQPSTSFETGFTVLKPPTSDNIVSSDSITQSMSHPPSQQFSLISSNRESNSTAVPGSSSVQHKYTSSIVCGTTSGNLSTNVLDLRDSVNYSSSIIFCDRPVLQPDKSFKPVSNVNVVHSQAKRAILFSDDTSNKDQTNMTYNTVNAPQNSNTINHKSHAVPDSNLSQSPISLTSHLVYNQELQEILAEQRLKTSSGLSLTSSLQSNMPSNIPIETPSSCGSGSSVFDALVDSPLKDSSHQVFPMAQPSTKGSLLCEMLLRTGSLPGLSVSDSHSSPLPISTTSTASESQRLLNFRTIAVSNTNSQNAVNECFIPCSSQRTTENAPTPGQLNGSQVGIPNDLVNQPSLKMNRMYKTRDPPQVGIVNPYISSTLDSVSNQSSLINTLIASGSTVVNEVDDQRRGDQSVVLSNNQARHTQQFLNHQPLRTNSVSQAEPISLQAMLEGVHATVPSVTGLFDRQSSSTVSEPKLNVTATAPPEQPVNPVSNDIPNVQSHVMNTASSNSDLSQTILIPVSAAGQHSGPLMYSAILCPSNGPIKLVPVMLASDQSMPVFAPSAQPIEEVAVMGAQSHSHQTSNLATATNINPAPRVAMQTSLPSNLSQQFLLSQGNDHQSSSSAVTLSLNNNLHLYLSQSDVLKAQVMPNTSATQMIPRTQTVQLMPHTQAVSAHSNSEQAILPSGNLASLALPWQSLGTVHESSRESKSSVTYMSGPESQLELTEQSTISTGLQIPKQKWSSGSASFSTLSLGSSSEEESKVFTNSTSLPETLNQIMNSSTFSLIHAPQVVMNAELTPHESQPIIHNGKWSLSKPEMGRFSEDTQDAYLTQNVQLHSLRSDVPKFSTNKGANVSESQTVLPISVQNSSSLLQNTTSVVLDSNSGNFLISGNQQRFLGLKSESTVSQTSSALPSQNCTFLLVPDQPNYPTYQIAMNPGDLLTSNGDKCFQNILSGSLQSQTFAQQTTSQSPKTLLEPSAAFLPLRTHGLETKVRSREDTIQPDFYNKSTITPPSTVSHAEVQSKESGKSSHLPLLLKRPRRTSHISESQLSLQPNVEAKSTDESRFKCTNMFSKGSTTSQQSTDSMSRAKEPNFVKSHSTSVNPVSEVASLYQQNPAIQTGQTISSNTISLPNLTNKPGDVTTIRNREIIDLTLDSPPRTPPSMHSTSVVQADTQQHQLCDTLQKPAPNVAVNNQLCDPSHGNGGMNTGTALLSHNILPQILHLSQASQDDAKEFAQELVNVQFVVIAQPNKLPVTFSTGAGTCASQGLSDKALADLISSFASQASASTSMVLQSQAQTSSSANKEMNLELTDFKSKEKEQQTLLPESSTYDLNSQLTIQPSRSVSQTEWSGGLTTAVTNSSTFKPSSSGLSLSFSTTQPISPSMKSPSVPIPCPSKPQLASVVMFTRATNTPSGAVGPPNITVMSPSRLRLEPSTILSAVVTTSQLSVTTSSLVTSTVTTPRAQVSISRSSTGEQAKQAFDSSPHSFARSLPLKISTHSEQTSNIRTADLSSVPPLAKRALPATKNMPAPKPKKNTVLELLKNKELARVASGAVTTSASLSVAVNQHTNVSSSTATNPSAVPFLFKNGPLLINQSSSQAPSLTSNSNIANITLLPANIKTALEPHQLVIRPNALHEAKIAPLGIQIISQVPIQQQTSGCSEGSVLPKLAITPQLQISAAQTANVSKPLLSSESKLKIISQPRSSLSLLAKPIVSGEKHFTLINSKQSNETSIQKSFVRSDSSGIDHNLIAGPIIPSTSVLQFQKPKLNTSFSSSDAVHSMATSNATFKLKLPSQHVNSNVKQFSERKTLLCTQQDSSPNAILLSSQPTKAQQLSEPQLCKFSFAQPVLTASNPMLSNMLFSNQATLPSPRLPDSSHHVPDGSDHYDQKSHKVNVVNAQPTIARMLRANGPLATPQPTTDMPSGTQSSKLTSNFSPFSKNMSSSTAHQHASSHNSMAGESSKSSFIQSHTKHEKDHFKNGRIDKIINDIYNRDEDGEETLHLEDNQAYFKNSNSATLQLTNMQTSMVQETANMSSNEMIGDLELRQINPNMIEKQTPSLSANASQTWKSPKKVKVRKLIPKINKKCVQFSDQLTKPSTLSSSDYSHSTLDKQSQSSSVYPKSFSSLERDLIHNSPSHHQAHQEKNPSESRLQELLSHDNQQADSASQPRPSLAGHQNVYNDKANQVRSHLVPERCSGYENYLHVFKQHSSEPTEKIAVNTASSLPLTTDVSVLSKSSMQNSSSPSSSDRDQQLPQKVYVMPQDQHQSLDQTQFVHSSFNILSDKGYFKLNNTRKAAALNASNPCLMEDNIMKNVRSFEGNATLTLQPNCWTKRSENVQFLSDPHPVQQVSSLPAEENVLAHSYQLAQQMSQGSASFSKDNNPSIETDSPEGLTKPEYAHQFKAERPAYFHRKVEHHRVPSSPSELLHLPSNIFSDSFVEGHLMEPIVAESSMVLQSISTVNKDISEKKHENKQLRKKIAKIKQKLQKSVSDSNQMASSTGDVLNEKKLPPDVHYQQKGESLKKQPPAGNVNVKQSPEYSRHLQIRGKDHVHAFQGGVPLESETLFSEDSFAGGFTLESKASHFFDRQESPELCMKDKDPLVSSSSLSRPSSQLEMELVQYDAHARQRYPSSENKSTPFRGIMESDSLLPLTERHRNPSYSQRSSDLDLFNDITYRQRNPSSSSMKSPYADFDFFSTEFGIRSRHPSTSYMTESFTAIRSRNPSGSSNRRSRPGSSSSDRDFTAIDDWVVAFNDIARTRSRNSSGESLEPTVEPMDHHTMQLYGPQGKH